MFHTTALGSNHTDTPTDYSRSENRAPPVVRSEWGRIVYEWTFRFGLKLSQLLEGNLTTSDLNKKSQWFNNQVVGLKLNDIFAFVKGLLKEPHRTAFLKEAKMALLHQFDSSDSDSREEEPRVSRDTH